MRIIRDITNISTSSHTYHVGLCFVVNEMLSISNICLFQKQTSVTHEALLMEGQKTPSTPDCICSISDKSPFIVLSKLNFGGSLLLQHNLFYPD